MNSILQFLTALGPWAVGAIYTGAMCLFISMFVLGLGAGMMFGAATGFWLFSTASTLAASLTFLYGRRRSRGWIAKKIETNPKVRAIDTVVNQGGWKMVALLRLTSVVPFTAMNYGLGLSKIPFWPYFFATWIGMMPGSYLLAHAGALTVEMALRGEKPQKSALEWAFLVLSVAVTGGLSVYATLRVKKILTTDSVAAS